MRNLLAAFLAAFALVLPAQNAAAQTGWIPVFKTDVSTVYVDMSSVKVNGNIRRYWEITRYFQVDKRGEIEVRWMMDMDCFEEARSQRAFVAYNLNGQATASSSYANRAPNWSPIVPGSNGTKEMNLVCSVK